LEDRVEHLTSFTEQNFKVFEKNQEAFQERFKNSLESLKTNSIAKELESSVNLASKPEYITSQSKIETMTSNLDYLLNFGIVSLKITVFIICVGGTIYVSCASFNYLNNVADMILKQPAAFFAKVTPPPVTATQAFESIPLTVPMLHKLPERNIDIININPELCARIDDIFANL